MPSHRTKNWFEDGGNASPWADALVLFRTVIWIGRHAAVSRSRACAGDRFTGTRHSPLLFSAWRRAPRLAWGERAAENPWTSMAGRKRRYLAFHLRRSHAIHSS